MSVGMIDCQIDFQLGSRRLRVDYRRVPFSAWVDLKKATGFTPQTLFEGIGKVDPEAFAAILFLERKQRERKLRYPMFVQEFEEMDDDFELLQITLDGRKLVPDDEEIDDEVVEDPTIGS